MNAMNSWSLEALQELGVARALCSAELSAAQIRDLTKPLPCGVFAYGRLPLMVSENCLRRNELGCTGRCKLPTTLTDRTGETFLILPERGCRNLIVNSKPALLRRPEGGARPRGRVLPIPLFYRRGAGRVRPSSAGLYLRRRGETGTIYPRTADERGALMKLRIRRLHNGVALPRYETPGAAGMDLRADLAEERILPPGERALIPTGLAIELPDAGYAAFVFARSGLAAREGLTLSNGVGVIDSDYRGELKVGVVNLSGEERVIRPGERIAQLCVMPVVQCEIEECETLTGTERGAGGFGSTGVR